MARLLLVDDNPNLILKQIHGVFDSAGHEIDTARTGDDGIRQAFLRRDPGSGVRIELIERKGGNFTDRSVEQLFRAFERQGLY